MVVNLAAYDLHGVFVIAVAASTKKCSKVNLGGNPGLTTIESCQTASVFQAMRKIALPNVASGMRAR